MSDPAVIWLSPWCAKCADALWDNPEDGRLWCVDPQETCEECGNDWVRYVIGDKDASNG